MAIVFAAQVDGKFAGGDVVGAENSSRNARLFAFWSAVVGVTVAAATALLLVASVASGGGVSLIAILFNLLILTGIGLAIGGAARIVKPASNLSLAATLSLGVVGSAVGGLFAAYIGTGSVGAPNIFGLLLAVLVTALLLMVAEAAAGRRRELD